MGSLLHLCHSASVTKERVKKTQEREYNAQVINSDLGLWVCNLTVVREGIVLKLFDVETCFLLLLGVRAYTVSPILEMKRVVFSRSWQQAWSLVSSVSPSGHFSALIALKCGEVWRMCFAVWSASFQVPVGDCASFSLRAMWQFSRSCAVRNLTRTEIEDNGNKTSDGLKKID